MYLSVPIVRSYKTVCPNEFKQLRKQPITKAKHEASFLSTSEIKISCITGLQVFVFPLIYSKCNSYENIIQYNVMHITHVTPKLTKKKPGCTFFYHVPLAFWRSPSFNPCYPIRAVRRKIGEQHVYNSLDHFLLLCVFSSSQ